MKTVIKYETRVDDITFGYFDEKRDGEFITLDSEEEIKAFTKRKNWQTELISLIDSMKNHMKDCIRDDLVDLQQRLDKLERKLEK